ncbi:MAG: ergothioneine biosynthesis protein EgtB [Blastocatellia bacterium]
MTSVSALTTRFREIRQASEQLSASLSPEDCTVQSMPDCSPVKWHLAHTTWFFETFALETAVDDYRPFQPAFRELFNSYYKSVGEQYPRPQRGLITRPGLAEIRQYRQYVDQRMTELFRQERFQFSDQLRQVVTLGLHHEQQHQELMLTDLKHALAANPLHPVYREMISSPATQTAPWQWREYDEGLRRIGDAGDGFCFDNEQPRHRVFVEAYALASRLVTCGEYLAFMADDGYQRPELWLSAGWDTAQQLRWQAPLYWEQHDDEWLMFTLSGLRKVNPAAPVCHISYYEADAYARWAQARLPTEAEWELAAAGMPVTGNFVESGLLHPAPVAGNAAAPAQMFGDVWEWTQSPYSAYPGFAAPAGALGEYNGKFMCNQMVLRGGSCVTPQSHIRATYRNFFPPDARWQFSGVRLAR